MLHFFLKSLLFIIVALCGTYWVGMQQSLPSAHYSKQTQNDDFWQLPSLAKTDPSADLDLIEQKRLWGAAPTTGTQVTENLTPPNWRIVGVTNSNGQGTALLQMEGKPLQSLHVNDVLPGGAKILHIAPEQLSIQLNGKKLALRIYRE